MLASNPDTYPIIVEIATQGVGKQTLNDQYVSNIAQQLSRFIPDVQPIQSTTIPNQGIPGMSSMIPGSNLGAPTITAAVSNHSGSATGGGPKMVGDAEFMTMVQSGQKICSAYIKSGTRKDTRCVATIKDELFNSSVGMDQQVCSKHNGLKKGKGKASAGNKQIDGMYAQFSPQAINAPLSQIPGMGQNPGEIPGLGQNQQMAPSSNAPHLNQGYPIQIPGMGQAPGIQTPIGTIQPTIPSMNQPIQPTIPSMNQPIQPTIPSINQPTIPSMSQPIQPTVNQPTIPSMSQPIQPTINQPIQPTIPSMSQPIQPIQSTTPSMNQPIHPSMLQPTTIPSINQITPVDTQPFNMHQMGPPQNNDQLGLNDDSSNPFVIQSSENESLLKPDVEITSSQNFNVTPVILQTTGSNDFFVRKHNDTEYYFSSDKNASGLVFSNDDDSGKKCVGIINTVINNSGEPLPDNFLNIIKLQLSQINIDWLNLNNIKIDLVNIHTSEENSLGEYDDN